MNKRLLIIAIPVVTGILCAGYIGLSTWKQTHFACDSQLVIVDDQVKEDVIMHFRFAGKNGHVETTGKYTPQHGQAIQTSNKVSFTFWREGDSLVMVSNETNPLPKMSMPGREYSPDFFRSREHGIRLKIIRKNDDGYLFLYDGTPTLYCAITPDELIRN